MATKPYAIILVLICTFLTAYAHVFWKMISGLSLNQILMSWQLWTGFFLLALGAAILITSFKHGDVSVLFPIIATSYIWVTLLSNHYFGESITVYKWIGVAGVVIGISILGKGSTTSNPAQMMMD